jgi:hypothetical protein
MTYAREEFRSIKDAISTSSCRLCSALLCSALISSRLFVPARTPQQSRRTVKRREKKSRVSQSQRALKVIRPTLCLILSLSLSLATCICLSLPHCHSLFPYLIATRSSQSSWQCLWCSSGTNPWGCTARHPHRGLQ